MGQFVQTNGDYTIKSAEGGKITLDTGPAISGGTVRVTGNLVIEGETLTVSAEDLVIGDNLIYLNNADPGPGVTLEWSGVQIKRGQNLPSSTYRDALFVIDDRDIDAPVWNIVFGDINGVLSYDQSNLRLRRIYTDAGTDSGNLIILDTESPNGVIKVRSNPLDDGLTYKNNMTSPNDIPNRKYVDDAIQNNPTFQILRGNTRVISFDKDDPLDPLVYFPPDVGPYVNQPTDDGIPASIIGVVIDNQINSTFFNNRAVIQGLEFRGTTITNDDSGSNILFRTNGSGSVQFNASVQLDYLGLDLNVDPGLPSVIDSVKLYANTPNIGKTGLYFKNPSSSDELISKNKALLFSMIF